MQAMACEHSLLAREQYRIVSVDTVALYNLLQKECHQPKQRLLQPLPSSEVLVVGPMIGRKEGNSTHARNHRG